VPSRVTQVVEHLLSNYEVLSSNPSASKKKEGRGKWGEEGEWWKEEVNLTKIYCKHVCKYHNVLPCTTIIC
jgi:hypothetical protein